MATMAYPPYDRFSRSMSRRQSVAYGAPPLGYQQYPDAMMSHGLVDYPQPSYQIYGPPSATVPMSHRLTGPSYDDLDVHDGYYSDDRHLSSGHLPLVSRSAMATGRSRHRRHSTVSFSSHAPVIDAYRRPSSVHIKFKRKGSFSAGISLAEAQDRVRLSGNDAYRMHEFHADSRDRILLRVQWAGYPPMTYEIPLDGYDGRVSLQTLARRVSRACVHYLQANVIPILWDSVQLHHLEEISYGVWQPMLSTR
ncbi:hypothetical protein Hypma_012474 [Hypsizygus marmoreus]|uniref:DUF6741 domain-containing protein n=1 Tax=Hypsizygus marmoreus TaxID=39966 RepID=A0A369JM43_HYPMA|nr:hypothetical protein Hypma_012474 [Hypsizygus marmoreus]